MFAFDNVIGLSIWNVDIWCSIQIKDRVLFIISFDTNFAWKWMREKLDLYLFQQPMAFLSMMATSNFLKNILNFEKST